MKTILRKKNKTQLIKVTDETFTVTEYRKIIAFTKIMVENSPKPLKNDMWPKDLVDGVGGYSEIYSILDPNIIRILADKCMSVIGSSKNYEDYLVMYYEGDSQSGLNWHTDKAYSASASIYLNDDWNDNYGGYFVFKMNGDRLTTAFSPDLGLAVFQKGKINHAVTSTRHDAPKRKSLQVFIR
jgi:hypothetical protein